MRPRQIVVTTSVAFALAFGSIATGVVMSDALAQDAVEQATPGTYDRADFYEEAPTATARTLSATRASSLSSVQVTAEMKYFTQYESHANYRQGFSYGDGYNALGYYQFDRRYSLISFMTAVYNLPQLGNRGAYLIQQMKDKLVEHKQYIAEYGVDLPEVTNWQWSGAK